MAAGAMAVAARPATRVVLGSKLYQKGFIKPRVPKPGLISREARKIADAGKPPQTLASVASKKVTPKMKVKLKRRAPTLEDERKRVGE